MNGLPNSEMRHCVKNLLCSNGLGSVIELTSPSAPNHGSITHTAPHPPHTHTHPRCTNFTPTPEVKVQRNRCLFDPGPGSGSRDLVRPSTALGAWCRDGHHLVGLGPPRRASLRSSADAKRAITHACNCSLGQQANHHDHHQRASHLRVGPL